MSTDENGFKSGSNLEKILKAGHFAFTGELGPPRGTNAKEVKDMGLTLTLHFRAVRKRR